MDDTPGHHRPLPLAPRHLLFPPSSDVRRPSFVGVQFRNERRRKRAKQEEKERSKRKGSAFCDVLLLLPTTTTTTTRGSCRPENVCRDTPFVAVGRTREHIPPFVGTVGHALRSKKDKTQKEEEKTRREQDHSPGYHRSFNNKTLLFCWDIQQPWRCRRPPVAGISKSQPRACTHIDHDRAQTRDSKP